MLQRAASNAYSWWWASHIRTKQSKWLEQSLQDMEEQVANALNLVQKDGDSFAKRAEMYYKHRPELIAFIEESVRAYRALAERYDKLSTDLQKANTTIASVFPDQLPYDTDYEDDDNNAPKSPTNTAPDPPKAPKLPEPKDFKRSLTKTQSKKETKVDVLNSGLTKEEAVEEIDKLQKDILSLQTMKEFTKSSYENGLAKFWEIEKKVTEMQQRVCSLRDEFNVTKDIEDDDARAIMAESALKSCEETLTQLQEKQEKSTQDAQLAHERIEIAKQKFKSLKQDYLKDKPDQEEEEYKLGKDSKDLQNSNEKELQERIIESLEKLSKKPSTVTEMADTVDKLVSKVISLETLVSSQTALIDRLRMETDDLQTQIRNLEDDKSNLIDGTQNLDKMLKDMEEKLNGVQDLDRNIENQNNSLKMQLTDACSKLEHLSENLQISLQDDHEHAKPKIMCMEDEHYQHQMVEKIEDDVLEPESHEERVKDEMDWQELLLSGLDNKEADEHDRDQIVEKMEDNLLKHESQEEGAKDEMNWQELLLNGLDDKEKVLLQEYTTILRKYKAAKKELAEEEEKNQGTVFEMKLQVRDLETLLTKRDIEIQQMKQKLKLLQEDEGKDDVSEEKEVVDEEDDIKSIFMVKSEPVSEIEEKLRTGIDAILDENLEFWLRFSSTFHQVQKFKTEVDDLQQDITQLKSSASRSEINPIYKHLKEIQNELTIWLEQSVSLKNELQRRCSSLSIIQEDIARALREGMEEEEIKFSTHQAAKFQGEVLNMQQENRKVSEELQAGLDHVTALQLETEKTLRRLEDEFGLSDHDHNQKHPRLQSRSHVPLRSFIFGGKSKKPKPSILACINPNKKLSVSNGGVM
ncbi:hypothetical protein Lser_V15G11960 [Lactuca serriola]